ncbi:MAG TPA: DEAD/DEAH box helicase family protein [Planctomycetaceae bacterium]|nr:DEAD/DEAH box helicase family protein [Planctomycetaceae bacterium]
MVIDPSLRWFPADEAQRDSTMDKLMPPLVPQLRRKVAEWRDGGYVGATETSRCLLRWWFQTPHLIEQYDGSVQQFEYFFAQREAIETVIWLIDVVGYKDKYDLIRYDSIGAVSAGMFDEDWRRLVIKMATGSGKTKVLSLVLAWSFFHKTYEEESSLSRNFLVIAPNIIVLDRIYRDFQVLRIFFADPVVPDNGFEGRNWRDDFQLTLHKQDEVRVTISGEVQAFNFLLFFGAYFVAAVVGFRLLAAAVSGFVRLVFCKAMALVLADFGAALAWLSITSNHTDSFELASPL